MSFPQEMWRPASGHSQTCYSAAEETDLKLRGYERLHEQVEFRQFPMMVSGKGLPDLIVENEEEAQAAVAKGYRLPDDAEIAAAREGFAAAHEPPVEDAYVPQRYPLAMRHPEHRGAIPVTWKYDIDGTGTAIPGAPEHLPDVIVYSLAEEAEWRAKGWTSPAPPIAEPPADASADDPELEEFRAWKRSQAQPRRKKMSGAARRKLALQRGEQHA
jgi:hypothetical protein